jgi:hypothetical protein
LMSAKPLILERSSRERFGAKAIRRYPKQSFKQRSLNLRSRCERSSSRASATISRLTQSNITMEL